jgi:hypothetical protein
MPLLVSPTAKQGIRHQTIGSTMQVSWNRSSSHKAGATKKVEPVIAPLHLPDRDIYFGGDGRHESLDIITFRAFESPGIETWVFRLDDPQRHHCSASGAPRILNPVCEHFFVPFGCAYSTTISRFVEARTIGTALRTSCVWKVTDVCAVITIADPLPGSGRTSCAKLEAAIAIRGGWCCL